MDEAFFSFHVLATASQPEQTAAAALRAGRASPARQPAEGSGPGAARSGGTGPSRQPGQLRGPEPPAPSSLRLRQRRRSRAPRKGSGPPTPAAGPPPGVPARLCRGRPPSAAPRRDPGAAALGRPLGSLRFISLGWEQILAFPSGQRLAGGGGREGGRGVLRVFTHCTQRAAETSLQLYRGYRRSKSSLGINLRRGFERTERGRWNRRHEAEPVSWLLRENDRIKNPPNKPKPPALQSRIIRACSLPYSFERSEPQGTTRGVCSGMSILSRSEVPP